jgi:hypothetical protein
VPAAARLHFTTVAQALLDSLEVGDRAVVRQHSAAALSAQLQAKKGEATPWPDPPSTSLPRPRPPYRPASAFSLSDTDAGSSRQETHAWQ